MRVLSLALTLFFVLDPFGNLPVVLSLLGPLEPQRRRRVIARESCFALALLTAGYWVGPRFIQLLGVDSADLTICGGVVLGIIALRLVFPSSDGVGSKETKEEPFIVPLAIPLMAGPSALATVMIMSAQSSEHPWVGLGMMALAWFITALLLFLGVVMGGFIPTRLLVAMERLAGLLLAVISIHMLMTGIRTYFVMGH